MGRRDICGRMSYTCSIERKCIIQQKIWKALKDPSDLEKGKWRKAFVKVGSCLEVYYDESDVTNPFLPSEESFDLRRCTASEVEKAKFKFLFCDVKDDENDQHIRFRLNSKSEQEAQVLSDILHG